MSGEREFNALCFTHRDIQPTFFSLSLSQIVSRGRRRLLTLTLVQTQSSQVRHDLLGDPPRLVSLQRSSM